MSINIHDIRRIRAVHPQDTRGQKRLTEAEHKRTTELLRQEVAMRKAGKSCP